MPADHFTDCTRCGQYRTLNDSAVCDICRMAERQPQGEAVRLFTPAPAQMPGQTVFGLSAENPGT